MKEILTKGDVAEMLLCDEITVADRLRQGVIPGLKFGRTWIIPAGALLQRLNDIALEESAKRREESAIQAPMPPQQQPRKRGRPRFVGSGVVV